MYVSCLYIYSTHTHTQYHQLKISIHIMIK